MIILIFNLNNFLRAISNTLDFIERDIFGVPTNHSKRIAYLSLKLAQELNFTTEEVFDIVSLSILHDNGASLKILHDKLRGNSKEKLSLIESMQEHCIIGEENVINFPFLTAPENVIKYHHETYDGSGFFGLSRDEIPIMSQIINFSDTLDLHFNLNNAYQNESLKKQIIEFVYNQRNEWFSPLIVDSFLKVTNLSGFWKDLTDEHITQNLINLTPVFHMDLTYKQIHNITKVFSKIIDAKSEFTQQHSAGLSDRIEKMSYFYNINYEAKMKLLIAADLHDIGKLAISNFILDKPIDLSNEEFDIIKAHPKITRICLKQIKGFEDITEWASNHHEKLNGTGYPRGLFDIQLDFYSRLLACLDIYQALREERPYRKSMTHIDAIKILKKMGKENLIDMQIVDDITMVFSKE